MISKNKVNEIINYALLNGSKKTLETFNLTQETFNRYIREYRKVNEGSENILNVIEMNDRFSSKELEVILKGSENNYKKINNGISRNFDGDEIVFGVLGDTHIGSKYFNEQDLYDTFSEMNKQNCMFCTHGGDVVEGFMNRPGDIYELTEIGYKAQRDKSIEVLSHWEKPLYTISGNHCQSFNNKLGIGLDIIEDISSNVENMIYLGPHEANIDINGIKIKLWHGGDGSSGTVISSRLQQVINSLEVDQLPDIVLASHVHKAVYLPNYRGVHGLESGCIQSQTGWMRSKRLIAHKGFWIIKMKINNNKIVSFCPIWYPL